MKKLIDRPRNDFDELNPDTYFWTDGNKVFRGQVHIKGANPKTFEYNGIFAKDDRKCFCVESWLRGANVDTFRPLNYTYAIDANNVYTITGKVNGAHIETFEVLDNGKDFLWYNIAGIAIYSIQGYAKDKNNIYYHNYEGKPKIVKNADLNSFISLGDTYFARDKNHIYGYGKVIKKANTETWQMLTERQSSLYSKDNRRIFYGFWEIEADYESFELVLPVDAKSITYQLAKDKDNFYRNGEIITGEAFEEYRKMLG